MTPSTFKRIVGGTAFTGGSGAAIALMSGMVTPEHIAIGAAFVAGGITVFASAVAALKSVSTDRKVDNITVLVDGRYSDVLQELSNVRGLLADRSGLTADRVLAEAAQMRSDDQAARVAESLDVKK